jgi:von Willebrand factor type A domain/Aerotolerance regulator N-terminal
MPVIAPLALLGLLFLPLVVGLYILRLRRPQRTVSSTILWQHLVRDVEANAPWQRLRRSLLLLVQLLLVAALAILAARPFGERPAGLSRDVVLVMDASASMSATDVFPDRLAGARKAALEALADLPADGRVSVIAAGNAARVVANEVRDRSRLTEILKGIEPTSAATDLADALKLAGALAARAQGAEIMVVTDDALAAAPDVRLAAPVRVVTVGRDRHNQAIVALAVRADASGVKRSVFVSIANLDVERAERRLEVLADGVTVNARELVLDALRRTEVTIDELPPGTRTVEARLFAPAEGSDSVDQLALDDHAWAIVPPDRLQRILLVGPGNVYLQNALALLPNVELYGSTPEDYAGTTGKELFDLVVFDGYLPAELPPKPILAIAPPRSSPLGTVAGSIAQPSIGQAVPDEPLLRQVDLTRVHVNEAQRMELPPWARSVIPGPRSAPLLYSGVREGLPTAVLAFDLRQSDLPLQVAWPILAANITGELLGLDPTRTEPVAPGAPVQLSLPTGASALRVTEPDGESVELSPAGTGAASVTFVGTTETGIYRVEAIFPPGASPTASPSASETATPGTSPTGSPGASPSSSSAGPAGGPPQEVEQLFAVDLFDPDESNIAPGDGSRLEALGTAATGGGKTGLARDEWWVPLALIALGLLLIEWVVYERDGARRLAAGLTGGLGRPRPAIRRRGS